MLKTINDDQYLQVVGLLTLAKTNMKRLREIEASLFDVLRVVGADADVPGVGSSDHIGDALYSDYSPTELLGKLGIRVHPQKARKKKES